MCVYVMVCMLYIMEALMVCSILHLPWPSFPCLFVVCHCRVVIVQEYLGEYQMSTKHMICVRLTQQL